MAAGRVRRGIRALSVCWIPVLSVGYCLKAIMATDDPYLGFPKRVLSPGRALEECLFIVLYAALLFAVFRPDRLPLSSGRRLKAGAFAALCGVIGVFMQFPTDGPPEGYVAGQFVMVAGLILAGHLTAVGIRGWVGRAVS